MFSAATLGGVNAADKHQEHDLDQALNRAAAAVATAQRVVAFTGAGVSAESGLGTYRDEGTGLWNNVDPEALASIDAWARDPLPMWAWYRHRAHLSDDTTPNAGHVALAQLGELVDLHVVTQNIDNLHERAGSPRVIHLHGSLFSYRCTLCGRPWRGPVEDDCPPDCPRCGNLVRPGVVWFGEPLPAREWDAAEEAMTCADVVIIVGTSGVVQPAAHLPVLAAQAGAHLVEVTPSPTEFAPLVDYPLAGTAATVLPRLAARVREVREVREG